MFAKPIPILDEHKRNHRHAQRTESEKRTRPGDTQGIIHGMRGQRQTNSKNRSDRACRRLCRGRVLLESVSQVIQHGYEDEQITASEYYTGHHGHRRVDGLFG